MVKTKDLSFSEPKRLPSLQRLRDDFHINYDSALQVFGKKLNNSGQLSKEQMYPLAEFISDYYEKEFTDFKRKLESRLECKLNAAGYILGRDKDHQMPIRDLAYFANKERKFAGELAEGRDRGTWVNTVTQDVGITTAQTDAVAAFIEQVVAFEELKPNDIIMLKYMKRIDKQSFSIYKVFNSVDVREKQSLLLRINAYADGFFGQNEDYSEDIDRLELDIINAIEGGCNSREMKTNDATKRVTHPKASNNNCFFKCIQPLVPELREKLTKSVCNSIRKTAGVKANEAIDVKAALSIFQSYSQGKYGLEIWSNDVLVGELQGTESTLLLLLENAHYSLIEIKKYQHCKDCGRKYINKHTCNTNMIVYKNITEGKHRYVVNGFKRDECNFDEPHPDTVIVHYDIETHTRGGADNMRIHTPYIVGYVDSISNSFQYFTGSDCMEQFIRHLFTYKSMKKVYINAFNGSKFDHYEFVKRLNRMYSEASEDCKLEKLVLNNGSILKASVGNIDCFDLAKHITGTLRQNLKEMDCCTQKGDFDYSLGDDWEMMAQEDQAACLRYLEGDVMGLKELSVKLNRSCFENFGANLYKFMSTSQLTYAVWVDFLYKESKNPIFLHTAEQEKFFRESIYGGRTYKYRNRFVSQQREAYISGELAFEDIDDYLVDADVNSLYPAAMKNEFPVGVPVRLKPNAPSVTYFNELIRTEGKCPKIGIYRVEFVSNKHLLDSILPRRENGRLIWDLNDGSGVYNSVDLDNALDKGYQIKLVEGWYFEKSAPVFDNYVDYLYQFKKAAKKGTAQYTLAKLMMNGLYGKTIQRPILDENVIIRLQEEFIKLHIKYGGVAMRPLSDGSYYLTYQDEGKLASKITKPTYLGSFILGYSRRIMLGYLQRTNPHFNSTELEEQLANAPYYTDTDSLQIHKRNLKGLELNKEIGGISDDLGDNCKILYGGWIAPKLYFLEFVEKTEDGEQIKYHLRGKGIPKEQLTLEMFELMLSGKSVKIQMQRDFKRINVNRTSKQQAVENFSILKLDALVKHINTVPWKGRHFIGNTSVPLGHSAII